MRDPRGLGAVRANDETNESLAPRLAQPAVVQRQGLHLDGYPFFDSEDDVTVRKRDDHAAPGDARPPGHDQVEGTHQRSAGPGVPLVADPKLGRVAVQGKRPGPAEPVDGVQRAELAPQGKGAVCGTRHLDVTGPRARSDLLGQSVRGWDRVPRRRDGRQGVALRTERATVVRRRAGVDDDGPPSHPHREPADVHVVVQLVVVPGRHAKQPLRVPTPPGGVQADGRVRRADGVDGRRVFPAREPLLVDQAAQRTLERLGDVGQGHASAGEGGGAGRGLLVTDVVGPAMDQLPGQVLRHLALRVGERQRRLVVDDRLQREQEQALREASERALAVGVRTEPFQGIGEVSGALPPVAESLLDPPVGGDERHVAPEAAPDPGLDSSGQRRIDVHKVAATRTWCPTHGVQLVGRVASSMKAASECT